MPIVTPPVPSAGIKPLLYARNGVIADGGWVAGLVNAANMLTGRRTKLLYAKGGTVNALMFGTPANLLKSRFRTSPYPTNVEVMMVLAKSNSATAYGSYQWNVGGVAQTTRYVGGSTAGTNGPNDLFVDRQIFKDGSGAHLAGSTVYDAYCTSSTNLQVVFCCVYEPQSAILSGSYGGLVSTAYGVGGPITGARLNELTEALWAIYREHGATPIFFSDALNIPATTAGTTWKNVLDGATTGYAAGAAGFWTTPLNKNTYAGTTVNVTFWAKAKTNTGTGGRVRFINSAGTLATITGFNTTESTISTTATMDATLTSDLVIVEHSDSAGNTVTTYAAGAYELET